MGYVRALRVLHRAFGRYPLRERAHTLIRFLTCPFLRTLDAVPRGARVLDIGSGHSLFGVLLADEGAAEVIGVDPDLRKSLLPTPSPTVRKVAGFDDVIRGTFDAVSIFDVAYLIPPAERRALFARVFARLAPGGTFLFKEMDPQHRAKMKWAHFQELLATRVLRITLGSVFPDHTRGEVIAMLEEVGFVDAKARDIGRGYIHPHLLYTARRPQ